MSFTSLASGSLLCGGLLYLFIERQQLLHAQTEQQAQALLKLSKIGAKFRGRKSKAKTDSLIALHKKNRNSNYMAPFNPSVDTVVNHALEMLQLKSAHKLWDLGCGDGRIVVEACVRHQCTGCGVEYDAALCTKSKERAQQHRVEERVTILHDDILNVDFSSAQRMYIFLLPEGLKTLTPRLLEVLKNKDARLVTYTFSLVGLEPMEVRDHKGTKLYLYTADSIV